MLSSRVPSRAQVLRHQVRPQTAKENSVSPGTSWALLSRVRRASDTFVTPCLRDLHRDLHLNGIGRCFESDHDMAARLDVRIGEDDIHHVMHALGLGRDA
jgi:hypothetical protein